MFHHYLLDKVDIFIFSTAHTYLPTSLTLYFAAWTPYPHKYVLQPLRTLCNYSPSYKLSRSCALGDSISFVWTILIHKNFYSGLKIYLSPHSVISWVHRVILTSLCEISPFSMPFASCVCFCHHI